MGKNPSKSLILWNISYFRTEDEDLIVHFDIKVDPTYVGIGAEDLEAILANEISVEESLFFRNLTIDANSLEVKPSDALPQVGWVLFDSYLWNCFG